MQCHHRHEHTRGHSHQCCGKHEERDFAGPARHAHGFGRGHRCEEERPAFRRRDRFSEELRPGWAGRGYRGRYAPATAESGSAPEPLDEKAWLEMRKQHLEARLAEINDELNRF